MEIRREALRFGALNSRPNFLFGRREPLQHLGKLFFRRENKIFATRYAGLETQNPSDGSSLNNGDKLEQAEHTVLFGQSRPSRRAEQYWIPCSVIEDLNDGRGVLFVLNFSLVSAVRRGFPLFLYQRKCLWIKVKIRRCKAADAEGECRLT